MDGETSFIKSSFWSTVQLKTGFLFDSYELEINIETFNADKTWYVPIQINQPTRCNNFSSLLLDIYVQLNMFRASSRPSSGAQQLQ